MMLKKSNGITLISLVIAVIVIMIMTGVLVYNSRNNIEIRKLDSLYIDIDNLNSKVDEYYSEFGAVPTLCQYKTTKDAFKSVLQTSASNENVTIDSIDDYLNPNDGDEYVVIDLKKMEGLSLIYGYGDQYSQIESNSLVTNEDEVYVINTLSHQIYYPHGVIVDGKIHFWKSLDTETLINFVGAHSQILMAEPTRDGTTSADTPFLGGPVNRGDIKNLTFETNIDINDKKNSSDIIDWWNVSTETDDNNAEVIAWYKESDESGKYDVTIGTTRSKVIASEDAKYLFSFIGNNVSGTPNINKLEYLDTNNVKNMARFFYKCEKLTNIDVSSMDTNKVEDMTSMFDNCTELIYLNINNFNTKKVQSMKWMFSECKKITNINLSHFDTRNVTTIRGMFFKCESVKSLDITNFDTSNVIDMGFLFRSCKNLISIDVSNFNTSNVTQMDSMFRRLLEFNKIKFKYI